MKIFQTLKMVVAILATAQNSETQRVGGWWRSMYYVQEDLPYDLPPSLEEVTDFIYN